MKLIPVVCLALVAGLSGCAVTQSPASRESLRANARQALNDLTAKNAAARAMRDHAVAIMVFPSVLKAGFLFGAQSGNGVLFEGGGVSGYYNTTAVSYGLQAGVQDFGYALFFMNESSLDHLRRSAGLQLGVGPSFVVADTGFASDISTATLTKDIYAFVFNQTGLMAGIGIAGSKITKIHP